jgi:hypothetical protein
MNSDLLVSRPQVKFAEVLGSPKVIQALVTWGRGYFCLFGDGIQFSIVCAESPGIVDLLGQGDGGTILAVTVSSQSVPVGEGLLDCLLAFS